jgi:hypothetical protein
MLVEGIHPNELGNQHVANAIISSGLFPLSPNLSKKIEIYPHIGDVNGSSVLTISNSAITLAKMADVPTGTIFYRKTAGTGVPQVQTLATLKTDLNLANVSNTSDANKPVSTLQQTALNLKANLASPALTGTPTAPTAAVGTNTTQIATTAFVQSAVAAGGGGSQDLQSVLDNGGYAEVEGGFKNSASILGGDSYDRNVNFNVYDSGDVGSFFLLENTVAELQNQSDSQRGDVGIFDGIIYLSQQDLISNKTTNVSFVNPIQTTTINIPAPSVAGTYTINTTPDTIYTVSTLPTGQLNDMAIVSDAVSPTYLGTLTGGGSVTCPVWHNGSTWVSR